MDFKDVILVIFSVLGTILKVLLGWGDSQNTKFIKMEIGDIDFIRYWKENIFDIIKKYMQIFKLNKI